MPDADLNIIERAYIYSARVHEGQVRLSGEPYLSHPLEVAGILADMKLDPDYSDLRSCFCAMASNSKETQGHASIFTECPLIMQQTIDFDTP